MFIPVQLLFPVFMYVSYGIALAVLLLLEFYRVAGAHPALFFQPLAVLVRGHAPQVMVMFVAMIRSMDILQAIPRVK